jgi:hypothetical protein
VEGVRGQALSFDGNDWVDIPDNISPSKITLAAWIKLTGFDDSNGAVIISKETGSGHGSDFGWRLFIQPGSHDIYFEASNGTNRVLALSSNALTTDNWYYVVGTYDGSNVKLYINGVLDGTTGVLTGNLNQNNMPTAIGHLQGWSVQWFKGNIDEVRIYNRALSIEEIRQNYEQFTLSNSGNGTWQHKRDLSITNPGSSLNYYQMLVNLSGVDFPIEANASGDDIRFTDSSGELPYWIERWDFTTKSGKLWVNVTNIPTGASTLRMWYGNPNATSSSNWNGTILPYVDSQATASAGWNARGNHASVVYNDAMWVLGGYYESSHKNDVWSSSDGITWTQATSAAGWSPRAQSIALNFGNKMWMIGGSITGTDFNDVWNSSDGITWAQATASSFTPARRGTAGVVFNNQMWIAGGVSGFGPFPLYNDVWKSSDGVTWTQVTANAEWSPRYDPTLLVFDNKMWIIGGATGTTNPSDVWYSSDGATWTKATENAGFGSIDEHSSVVFDNKMWIFGGYSSLYSGFSNNAWYSSDGVSWTQATASAGWSARSAHTSVVFNDKVWIMGGAEASGMKNDVWRMLRKYASPEPSVNMIGYINGIVQNNSAGIAGAIVTTNTGINATTNAAGFYSMLLTSGEYNLTAVSEPRFYINNSINITVVTGTTMMQDIELIKKPTGNISGGVSIK